MAVATAGSVQLPLLPRLLTLRTLVGSVAAIDSAAAAQNHPALELLRRAFLPTAPDGEGGARSQQDVVASRVWRERHVLNDGAQTLLQTCQLQQVAPFAISNPKN